MCIVFAWFIITDFGKNNNGHCSSNIKPDG